MKRLPAFFSLFALSICAFSQSVKLSKNDSARLAFIDTIARQIADYRIWVYRAVIDDSTDEDYFSYDAYDRFFDRYFTLMKYERESFTEGNSAALDFSDNQTRMNLALSRKHGNNIFTIGTALNVSDKTGILFSENRPTAGTEVSFGFSRMITSLRLLNFKGREQAMNFAKRRETADSLWILHCRKNPIVARRLLQAQHELDSLFELYNHHYDSIEASANYYSVNPYRDSLLGVIDKRAKNRSDLQAIMITGVTPSAVAKRAVNQARDIAVAKEMETDGVNSFHFAWLTINPSYRKDKYQTYDRSLTFAKRPGEKTFDKWSATATFNYYWQRTDSWIRANNYRFMNSAYAGFSYALVRTNSFESVKEQNLLVITNAEQNDTTYQFSSSKKVRDISGREYENRWLHRFTLVATGMLGKQQFFGINFKLSTDLPDHDKPVFNTRVGGLFRFRSSETEKSVVNFEVFFAFNDLSDSKDISKSAWQRKEVGVSATVPFQKVFFR